MAQTVPSPIQSNQFRPQRTGNPAVDDALRQSFDPRLVSAVVTQKNVFLNRGRLLETQSGLIAHDV